MALLRDCDHHCDSVEPLRASPPLSPVHQDDVLDARDDHVPVLPRENGACPKRSYPWKKPPYLSSFGQRRRLIGKGWWRVVVVMVMVGMTLTCVALVIVLGGAEKSGGAGGSDGYSALTTESLQQRGESQTNADRTVVDDAFTFKELAQLNNYALDKPAAQSSLFPQVLDIPELDGGADFAVDGSLHTCARTDVQHRPFWLVDLGQVVHVRVVRLHGSDVNRLNDADIYVGNNENVTDNALCARHRGDGRGLDIRVVCEDNSSGRYLGVVLLTQPDRPQSLIICEVLVYQK